MTARLPLVVLAVCALAAGLVRGQPRAPAAKASASPKAVAVHVATATRCEVCHSTAAWTGVTFDHSRTGFPLTDRHAGVQCAACHTSTDFKVPVPTNCSGCHRDVHEGELGTRCASCHDTRGWQSRFDANAHRRTNFPLTGRHALIPCEECHLDQRDRSFARAAVECVTCHRADLLRAAAVSIDHTAAGFGTNCAECHSPSTFRGARFAAHDACFQLSAGPHAGIRCLDCHTTQPTAKVTGACATNSASCTRCHTCPTTAPKHTDVTGFQCKDRKCYECHQFVSSGQVRPRLRGIR